MFKNGINNVVLCDNSKMGESGRKSASADDEETEEAGKEVKKLHKNGAMFEEARRMLSSSLKRVYRYADSRSNSILRSWSDFLVEMFCHYLFMFFIFVPFQIEADYQTRV